MGVIEGLRNKFEQQDKAAAAHEARLRTLATKGPLGKKAWKSLNEYLDPAAEIHLLGPDGGALSDADDVAIAGKPSGSKRGAL